MSSSAPPSRPRREHWLIVVPLLLFVALLVYQIVPDILREQVTFVRAEHVLLEGVVLDEGEGWSGGRNGGVRYYPTLRFDDGRQVRAEEHVAEGLIPPVGGRMQLVCDRATRTRCREPSYWGIHGNLIGLCALLLVCCAGPLWAVAQIFGDVRRRRRSTAG